MNEMLYCNDSPTESTVGLLKRFAKKLYIGSTLQYSQWLHQSVLQIVQKRNSGGGKMEEGSERPMDLWVLGLLGYK